MCVDPHPTLPCPATAACPAGPEPQSAQPCHRQARGLEAHARLTEPAPAGTREPCARLACPPASQPLALCKLACCTALRCAQQAPQSASLSTPSCAPSFPALPACLLACLPALQATSSHATRGAFATKHLWVTPYHPREMNPAGDYPLHPDPDQNQGIAQWAAKNRSLNGADCVLWYNMGLTHIVRCEVGGLPGCACLPAAQSCLQHASPCPCLPHRRKCPLAPSPPVPGRTGL